MNKYFIFIFIIIFNCAPKVIKTEVPIQKTESTIENILNSISHPNFWYFKDLEKDSIPGISLEKSSNTILKAKKRTPLIVAIIDTDLDVYHESLRGYLWRNSKEIENNNIDDDNNGYIDDINGWNFLGNITEANKEYVRIYRFYKDKFESIDTTSLNKIQIIEFEAYKVARKKYQETFEKLNKQYKSVDKIYKKYIEAKNILKNYLPEYKYSLEILNKIDTVGNDLKKHVDIMHLLVKYKDTDENFTKNYNILKSKIEKRVNIDFNERDILDENEHNINDIGYGNHKFGNNLDIYFHATEIAGVIKDDIIKIMPLAIVPNGDTHDKDIALAIRYAVDNGAKVINMSFGKDYSLHKEWVFDALKYAEKNNVLIVSSAGNSRINLDEVTTYPNDHNGNGIEVSDNFLMVGGSTKEPNENLYYKYSNYGATTVDVFAPADSIYTAMPNNKYKYDSGTSLASALTSKVAALIFSYYPNLTASQVKHIIMDSGVEYTFPVKTPTKEDKDKMTPFNELSKSGKIVNAYNALIMADSVSKANKRKRD